MQTHTNTHTHLHTTCVKPEHQRDILWSFHIKTNIQTRTSANGLKQNYFISRSTNLEIIQWLCNQVQMWSVGYCLLPTGHTHALVSVSVCGIDRGRNIDMQTTLLHRGKKADGASFTHCMFNAQSMREQASLLSSREQMVNQQQKPKPGGAYDLQPGYYYNWNQQCLKLSVLHPSG